jgi:hypothetical protein
VIYDRTSDTKHDDTSGLGTALASRHDPRYIIGINGSLHGTPKQNTQTQIPLVPRAETSETLVNVSQTVSV